MSWFFYLNQEYKENLNIRIGIVNSYWKPIWATAIEVENTEFGDRIEFEIL